MTKKITYAGTREKVFFPELWGRESEATLRRLNCKVEIPDFTEAEATPEMWRDFLADSDAIITTWCSPRIDAGILARTPNLQIVGHAAGSVVDYVSPELFDSGAKVVSANDDMAHAVAEWCLLGGLMGRRNVMSYTCFGGSRKPDFPGRSKCSSFRAATIGIWGFGAVAAHLVSMLQPLLPDEILVNSSHMSAEEAARRGVTLVELDELLSRSDVVFTLAGLSDKTVGKLDARRLALLRDGAVLVNAGRGHLIQEQALYDELSKGRITGVLDVYHQEPLPDDSPLLSMPNVILTPHNAGYPSRYNYISTILMEIDRRFRGEPLRYEVRREQVAYMTTGKLSK